MEQSTTAGRSDGTSPVRANGGGDRNGVGGSDAELLGRVARGDQQAFAVLYDRHCRSVYGLVLRVVRDPAHADEVTQEVFVQAWRIAARYDSARGTPGTWLRTLAHRRAVDRVRSEQAARDRDRRASALNGNVVVDPVADDVELAAEYAAVRSALAALTDLQREAVTLAYFGGHTYRRVAELLGIPTPTAKSRIRDGLVRLRDTLERSSRTLT